MKYRLISVFMLAVMGGIMLAIGYVNPYTDIISLSELILQLSGSRGDLALGFSMNELLSFVMRMIPDFIFEICFGTMIYQHLCTASVYVFSRYTKRLKWYFKEVLSLGALIITYQLVLVITVILITVLRYQIQLNMAGIILFLYHNILRGCWIFCMTLVINILSILFGSGFSFMGVMGLQIINITMLSLLNRIARMVDISLFERNIKWNLLAHLVLGWHESSLSIVDNILNPPYSGLELNNSVLIFVLLCIITIFLGAILINTHDLIVTNAEEGEI